jgi:hypothetical protein
MAVLSFFQGQFPFFLKKKDKDKKKMKKWTKRPNRETVSFLVQLSLAKNCFFFSLSFSPFLSSHRPKLTLDAEGVTWGWGASFRKQPPLPPSAASQRMQ